jgi:glycosyltransferase involved in cell wall biosynthesis
MPSLSVLLCTRNRGEKIRNAVDSILGNTFTDFELLVVDQSTDGKTLDVMVTYRDPRIRYMHTDTVGLSRSRNIAIRSSKAEIIVFTDDDCICDTGWLAAITGEYNSDPTIMGVYGRVLPYGKEPEGMICHCLIDSPERRTVNSAVIPYEILGHGNNMSFRKEVFRRVGLYIESLGAGTWMKGGEDTDLVYRALRARMKLAYSPNPLVYHDNWMPISKAAELEYGYILSAIAVFVKYALRLDYEAFKHILERLNEILKRIYYHLKRGNKNELELAFVRLRWFLIGIIMGIKYFFVATPKFKERL